MQGEGAFAGRPASFIRLEGCNLHCVGCDTRFVGQELTVRQIVERVDEDFVVITGGEPCMQNLGPLVQALVGRGHTLALESNGTLSLPQRRFFRWVCVSPKTHHLERLPLLPFASEVKIPVGHERIGINVQELCELVARVRVLAPHAVVSVQPWLFGDSSDRSHFQAAYRIALECQVRVSLQIHKYLEVE